MSVTPARLTRAERKAATRDAVLEAGHALFVRDGFHRATLDRVAAEAGFTKGAVYASFATKADLFLEVFAGRVQRRCARIARSAAAARSMDELEAAMTAEWQGVLEAEQGWSLLLIEFWVHAAREPGLRERLLELHLRLRDALTAAVRDVLARDGGRDDFDVEAFVVATVAMGNGFNLEAFLDPAGVPERFARASHLLADGFSAEAP